MVALPRELTVEENIRLIESFARCEFTDKGAAVEIAIHPSDDPKTGNIHAHLLVTSRRIEGAKLTERLREFGPVFAGKPGGKGFVAENSRWAQRWAAFQEWFALKDGIQLEVDPISAIPKRHVGPSKEKAQARIAVNEERRRQEQELLRDPTATLAVLSQRLSVFSLKDIVRLLKNSGIDGMEARQIAWKVLGHVDIVALDAPVYDGKSLSRGTAGSPDFARRAGERRYTTRSILAQEERILDAVDFLYTDIKNRYPLPPQTGRVLEKLIQARGLDAEQADGARHLLRGPGIAVLQGKAGAGKSYLLTAVADALGAVGYQVIGLAPTNAVVGNMRKDGYKDARTLHRFLNEVERGRRKLGAKDVLLIDEGAMIDTGVFDRVTSLARSRRCRIILVGDDRQLAPVGRGGIYTAIRRKVGSAELKTVRRQRQGWMREASQDLSEWRIDEAIKAYSAQGGLVWNRTIDSSASALVEQWGHDFDAEPAASAFVYAGTNFWVDELNRRIQRRRWLNAPDRESRTYSCCRGEVTVRVGERVQFHANDAKLGLYNGTLATVTDMTEDGIRVLGDDGTAAVFNPERFADWGLGYAGTVFRGQGKTQDRVYALYDHSFVWGAASTYVALTRHRDSVKLYVPRELAVNEPVLVEQMSRASDQILASDLVRSRPDVAQSDLEKTLYPLQPPIPFGVGTGNERKSGDLNLKSVRRLVSEHFWRTPVANFTGDYQRLARLAKAEDARSDGRPSWAELLRREVAGIAWTRGFLPASGALDPKCLDYTLSAREMTDHFMDDRLAGDGTRANLQCLAFQPDNVRFKPLVRVGRRLRQLEAFVLDHILEQIQLLRHDLAFDQVASAALGFAGYLVRVSKALVYGLPWDAGPAGWRSIRADEAAPRLVWKPLRIYREGDREWPEAFDRMAGRFNQRLFEATRMRLGGLPSDVPVIAPWKPGPEAPLPRIRARRAPNDPESAGADGAARPTTPGSPSL